MMPCASKYCHVHRAGLLLASSIAQNAICKAKACTETETIRWHTAGTAPEKRLTFGNITGSIIKQVQSGGDKPIGIFSLEDLARVCPGPFVVSAHHGT